MSANNIRDFYSYIDGRVRAGLDQGVYQCLVATKRGNAPEHGARLVYLAMLSDVREKPDDLGRIDRCVWTGKSLIAARSGVSEPTVTGALKFLVAGGLIFEYRSARMGAAKTSCYLLPDVVADAAALAAWTVQARDDLVEQARGAAGTPVDGEDEAAAAQVKARVKAARAEFVAKYPLHKATDARTLAVLLKEKPVVGTTRGEAVAGMAAVKAAMAEALAERGVHDPEAAVARFIADRKANDQRTTAKALSRVLEQGGLEHLMPASLVTAAIAAGAASLVAAGAVSIADATALLTGFVTAWAPAYTADHDGRAPSSQVLAWAVRDAAAALIAKDAADLLAPVDADAPVDDEPADDPYLADEAVGDVDTEEADEAEDPPAWGVEADAPIGLLPAAPAAPAASVPAPRPTSPERLGQLAELRRAEACDALLRDHRPVVNGVALRLGVDRDAAAEELRAAKARWVDANTTHAGDEPTTDETEAALPAIADGLVKEAEETTAALQMKEVA